jgi:deoxyribodipyrimidine photolyase-related protein
MPVNKSVFIVFPHQLFQDITPLKQAAEVILTEEFLFFNQYKFHKQKLLLHRASMKYYQHFLEEKGIKSRYVEAVSPESDIRKLVELLAGEGVNSMQYYDVCDCWLEKRLTESCHSLQIDCQELPTPLFINTKDDLKAYFGTRSKYFQSRLLHTAAEKTGTVARRAGQTGRWQVESRYR